MDESQKSVSELEKKYENNDIADNASGPDSNLHFEETEEAIILRWQADENAVRYRIFIRRGEEEFEKDSTKPGYELKRSVYDWKCGDSFQTTVEAADKNNKEWILCDGIKYVIGGENVVSELNAKVNENHPHRKIDLKWTKPANNPEGYTVSLHAENGDKIQTFSVQTNSTSIDSLTQLTEYYCTVEATYKDASLGKPVRSNIVKMLEQPVLQEVNAYKNKDNPSREIIVNWKNLETELLPTRYEVYLGLDKGTTECQTHASNVKEAVFKCLKSNTTYTAWVTPIASSGDRKRKSYHSQSVTTDHRVIRNQGFNIEKDGKPVIRTCSFTSDNGELASDFSWELADIGEEANSFKLDSVNASYKGHSGKRKLEIKNNHEAKPVKLNRGKTYSFCVVCNYTDLDSGKTFAAQSEQTLHTDIGTPKITSISWTGEEITVIWVPADGASNHTLRVLDGSNKEIVKDKVTGTTHSFKMTISCSHGKMCTVELEATGGEDKLKKSSKKVLIGGDEAVTDAIAIKDEMNPRRHVIIKWKPPKKEPQRYELALYELQQKSKDKDILANAVIVDNLQQTHTSHRFTELKSSTKYICKVFPVYYGTPHGPTYSSIVVTDRRITQANERDQEFGTPEQITHNLKTVGSDSFTAELSWTKLNMGENFKILNHHVTVVRKGHWWVLDTKGIDVEVKPESNSVSLNVTKGAKYDVTFKTKYIDLDLPGLHKSQVKNYVFCTVPSETTIEDCKQYAGVVYFTWTPVNGAKQYCLTMMDEFSKTRLAPDVTNIVTEQNNGCQVKVPLDERLRNGQICMTKVKTTTEGGLTSETEWKRHLIGGKSVPRNVTARRYPENPKRCVLVTFDAPADGPAKEYKVVAIPCSGKRKTEVFQNSPAVFEYLRAGIQYEFEVSAKGTNQGSLSNPIKTDGDHANKPLMKIQDASGNIDMSKSSISGSTTNVNIVKGEEFGKARDIRLKITNDGKNDIIETYWKVPSFDNRPGDYKVEKYEVDIIDANGKKVESLTIPFKKNAVDYCTAPQKLDLGETYEISVVTWYEDIDADKTYFSSAKTRTIITRPGKPDVIFNGWKCDILEIEWNAVKGARNYSIEIFTEDSDRPKFAVNLESKTEWSRKFDEEFGYGTSYYAKITAYGKGNKENSVRTEKKTIGGDLVPTNVIASINNQHITEPNTQVFLQWDEPKDKPQSYQVEIFPEATEHKRQFEGKTCLVSGLKAGMFYRFKVMAIHVKQGLPTKSGGCFSNRIQTDPKPTQVKNVECFPGKNPSISYEVRWDKVDVEKFDESTKYRVSLAKCTSTESEEYRLEVNSTSEEVILRGLEPGTTYEVGVAGGNSEGYGRESDKVKFTTEFGTPKNVQLVHNRNPSTSLTLLYEAAEGNPTGYVATLYKKEHEVKHEVRTTDVNPGYLYEDLDPNTKYFAKVQAIFGNGKAHGDFTESEEEAMTAPSRPSVIESGYSKDPDKSSKELFLEWKTEKGCNEHLVLIKRGNYGTEESCILVKEKNTLQYSCLYEATQYSVQVRSQNASGHFGDPSDEAIINLAPAKLENVVANLEKDGTDIIVQCNAAEKDSPFYFMQPVCNGKPLDIIESHAKTDEKIVKFRYSPEIPAERYTFLVWSENSVKTKGKKTDSNAVLSRPNQAEIKDLCRCKNDQSTDIKIEWQGQERCDAYEALIQIQGQGKECLTRYTGTSCTYRCKSPGSTYTVNVRAVCDSVRGDWSEDKTISLAPGEVKLIEDGKTMSDPVNFVEVKWEPLDVKPAGYVIALYEGKDKIDEHRTQQGTSHRFETKLKPGSLCHCTVAAYIEDGKVEGKSTISKFYRIAWSKPSYFLINIDDNDPCRRAKISWDKPFGVNCFKLHIENNLTGIVLTEDLKKQEYIFKSGIPGNTYTAKLYCGCDGRYDLDCEEKTIVMQPEAPSDINVSANSDVKGLVVEFNDKSNIRKLYEVTSEPITSPQDRISRTTTLHKMALKNLVPGESYAVSVAAVIGDRRSEELSFEGYVKTLPDELKNLRSKLENGCVVFEWNPPEIQPDEYIVQWRVDNDPITEERTQKPTFSIHLIKPAHCYRVRVSASNSSGCGIMSNWEEFISDPLPPYNIQVKRNQNSPETSFIVQFDDDRNPLKTYVVTAVGERDESTKSVTTDEHYAIIEGLTPNKEYTITVKTIFCGKSSKLGAYTNF